MRKEFSLVENYPLNSNYLTWCKHRAPREYLKELLKESRKGVSGGILRRGSFAVWRNNEERAGSRGWLGKKSRLCKS